RRVGRRQYRRAAQQQAAFRDLAAGDRAIRRRALASSTSKNATTQKTDNHSRLFPGFVRPPMDYYDLDALPSLGLAIETAERLLAGAPLTGPGGRRMIEAERLPDLLAQLEEGRCE